MSLKWMGPAIVGGIGLAIVGIALTDAANGVYLKLGMRPISGSYQSCRLSEMRGQQSNIISIVDRYCAQLYRYPIDVIVAPGFSWSGVGQMAELILEPSREWEFTNARVTVHKKTCDETGSSDWSKPVSVVIIGNAGMFTSPFNDPKCLRLADVTGYPK